MGKQLSLIADLLSLMVFLLQFLMEQCITNAQDVTKKYEIFHKRKLSVQVVCELFALFNGRKSADGFT